MMTKSTFKLLSRLLLFVYVLTVVAPFWMHHHDDLIVSFSVSADQVKSTSDASEPSDSQKPVRAHDCYICAFTHHPVEVVNVFPLAETELTTHYHPKNQNSLYLEIFLNSSPERGPPTIS